MKTEKKMFNFYIKKSGFCSLIYIYFFFKKIGGEGGRWREREKKGSKEGGREFTYPFFFLMLKFKNLL